ncbi:MAG: hypothetical protein KJ957_03670 [Candidatus Omnitrophica bacterium]|nr:hypothetical protein [Candidatus Omnitrophota bacterium]
MEDEKILKIRIERYQQRIFSLALYLIGGNQDNAYDITASSFVEVIRKMHSLEKEDIFFTAVSAVVVRKSRDVKVMPSFSESDFAELPFARRKALFLVRRALQSLPFDTRAILLLRDQLHLLHKDIAVILHASEDNARSQTTQARILLRDKIKEVLSSGG